MFNLLVVDDSGVIRLQIRQMLKDINCRIFEAVDGKQVLQNTFNKDYSLSDMHLVILDIHLGEIDGYDILKIITRQYPNLPVIMMSVERKKENILKCIELGAKDYILKPFDKELLTSRIKRFHKILSRDQMESDIKEVENAIFYELDRAVRVNSPLTVLMLKIVPNRNMEQNIIYNLKENLVNILRKIDTVIIFKRFIVLILPVTNRDGLDIVKAKISKLFIDFNINNEDIREKSYTYPDDVDKKELIKNYDINGINNSILDKLKEMIMER